MTRFLFPMAYLLGAAAIVWMGFLFVGSNALALMITLVIGAVYTIGFGEILQYRKATATLANGLRSIPAKIDNLNEWLNTLDPSLQNAVRLRIEGERVGLPAPVLAPYLVGLLVMLGLLGTLVGMVETMQGAMSALQGTTDLLAMQTSLAAPLKGLGMAFGTSVAGVASSAVLGLLLTLSRRDRMLETRQLDSKIASVFQDFSLTHNRNETFKALQIQAHSLPDVADKLNTIAERLATMGDNLGDKLIANQNLFHESVKNVYAELVTSVDQSLKAALTESARLSGECIKPIMQEAMAAITRETQNTHQQLTQTAHQQLEALAVQFTKTSQEVNGAWQAGLLAHEHANENLIGCVSDSLTAFTGQFKQTTVGVLESLDKTLVSWGERQAQGDQERLQQWSESAALTQNQFAAHLIDSANMLNTEFKQVTDLQQSSLTNVTSGFETMLAELTECWRQTGAQAITAQQNITASLAETAREMSDTTQVTSTNMLNEITSLLKSSEDLIQARIQTEENWANTQGERIEALTSTIRNELSALRDQEEHRGQAALERFAELENTLATHLATLGKELEEPMTRLIETASETPRAAAEVIGQLRSEISKNIERDNSLLEERRRIMEDLNTLSNSMAEAATGQREAIETLVSSSAEILKDVGAQFSGHVDAEVTKLTEMSDHFASSAVEMSSLGEAFGLAVHLFNESNSNLIENLHRIEESLDRSSARSDEQLNYYVAQARELIDHNMLSQKEIFEEMHRHNKPEQNSLVEVADELAELIEEAS